VSVPAIDLHDRFVVAAFDAAPDGDAAWTVTDDAGVARTARLVGYVPAVRLAVLSVDVTDDDPAPDAALPAAPWAQEMVAIGSTITIAGREAMLVSIGNQPTADGLALEHALVADTDDSNGDGAPEIGEVVWSGGKIVGLVVHRVDGQVSVIPSNLVQAAASSVIGSGATQLAWLGVSVTTNDHGQIVVSAVNPTSPASVIGLRLGDVIVSVNGADIDSPADLVAAVWRCGAGHDAHIAVLRDGATITLQGALAAMPVNA